MNNNTDDERKLTPLSGDDSAPGWLVLFGITGFLMGAVAMHALETPSERPAFEKETITHGNAEIASNLTADMNLSFGTDLAHMSTLSFGPDGMRFDANGARVEDSAKEFFEVYLKPVADDYIAAH